MAVIRWDPWAELAAVQRDVQELFGRTSPPASTARMSNLVPPMDVRRTDGGLEVTMELPGLSPDQVEVHYDRGVLTISGQRTTATEDAQEGWLRRERAVGSFSRSLTISEGIDPSAIQASFDHGVLSLQIPSAPQEQPQRIPVSSGQAGAGAGQTVEVEGTSRTSESSRGNAQPAMGNDHSGST